MLARDPEGDASYQAQTEAESTADEEASRACSRVMNRAKPALVEKAIFLHPTQPCHKAARMGVPIRNTSRAPVSK